MDNTQNPENEKYVNKIDRHEAAFQKITYGFWAAGVIISVLAYFNITLNNDVNDIRGEVDGLKAEVAELETTIRDSRKEFELVKDSLKTNFVMELDTIVQVKIDEYPTPQISRDISELRDLISTLSDNLKVINEEAKDRDSILSSKMITRTTRVTWNVNGDSPSQTYETIDLTTGQGRNCINVGDPAIAHSEDNYLCFEQQRVKINNWPPN